MTRKIALITGASHGIGAASARMLAAEGFDICVNYRSDHEAAARVVAECEEIGVRAVAVSANVGDHDDVRRLFDECDDRLGQLTCLVNNAGIIGAACRIEELSPDVLAATFAINTFGPFYCTQQAALRMSTRHGGAGGHNHQHVIDCRNAR
ncbi:SDR family NAD(P)-dependent oxidoreductase [Mesorhizobium sp. KR2-14]|uniref:SDR family NAD(P)-dependent oxidoreductase n=1 Tax=Mesorhizobium sp. KR2-14 TaxID=3156610 RepID=UPI0032B3B13D